MVMLTFFILVVILELAVIVGLVYAYLWIHNASEQLVQYRSLLVSLKALVFKEVRQGNDWIGSVFKFFSVFTSFLPWWVKAAFNFLGWIGKLKPQTS